MRVGQRLGSGGKLQLISNEDGQWEWTPISIGLSQTWADVGWLDFEQDIEVEVGTWRQPAVDSYVERENKRTVAARCLSNVGTRTRNERTRDKRC